MKRTIVINDSEPSKPVVRYLDLDFNNPAKSCDSSIGRVFVKFDGDQEEKAIAFGDVIKN